MIRARRQRANKDALDDEVRYKCSVKVGNFLSGPYSFDDFYLYYLENEESRIAQVYKEDYEI